MNQDFLRALLVLSAGCFAQAQVSVTTYHNDNARTGQNTTETVLTPALLSASEFGKLFSQAVDGEIYAQPLVLNGLSMNGAKHSVVYVATEHGSVYAFDALTNKGASANPLWQVSFINPAAGITPVSTLTDINCGDVVPEVVVTGTPVIDTASGTLYLIANTKENGVFYQRLHALDVRTGAEKFGGPVAIQASVPGSGIGSVNGMVSFDALQENQRAALLLQNDVIYIAWAAHCDIDPYHGWVMAYDSQTLKQLAVWNSTPNGTRGGIWQGGAGLTGDGTSIYFATGNGTADVTHDTGDSVLRMGLNGTQLIEQDQFTAFNQQNLNQADTDLGAGGVLALPMLPSGPNPYLAVAVGKEGRVYLLDRTNLGGFNKGSDKIVQELPGAVGGVWGMGTYWNNTVFIGGQNDSLKAFSLNANGSGLLSTAPTSQTSQSFAFPGPTVSVSASDTSNGVVWALETSAYKSNGPGVLHAYDATNLGTELWNSQQRGTRDVPGPAIKFSVPTVANGRVYVGTTNQLSVYGEQAAATALPVFSLVSGVYGAPQKVTITDATPGATIYYTTDGTVPSAASSVYSAPIGVFKPITLRAVAIVPGEANPSGVANALYTIQYKAGNGPNYQNGFTTGAITLNSVAKLVGTALELTDGGNSEATSAFYNTPINAASFISDFTFQITKASGDGFTFCLQNDGPTAVGVGGGGLGFQNLKTSVGVKFDIYNNAGEGTDSTGIYLNGAFPDVPAIDMSGSGITLLSGRVYNARIIYGNSTMLLQVLDPNISTAFFQTTFTVDVPGTVGAPSAYAGFTGGTGSATAVQQILTWNLISFP